MTASTYGKRKRYRIKYKNVALLLAMFLLIVLLIGKGCSALFSFEHKEKPNDDNNPANSQDQPQGELPNNSAADPTKQTYYSFNMIEMPTKDISSGNLVLVNNNIPYKGSVTDNDLVTVRELKNNAYSVKDYSVKILPVAMDALNEMMADFNKVTNNDSVRVIAGHRTIEYQQNLYSEDLAKTGSESSTYVAKAGYSEHHTGLAIDFTTVVNGGHSEFDGTGDYSWINENCYKYGYINRYPLGKESLTFISNEPWHFRYVGIPHATVMKQHSFCLEEYIDFIKNYTIFTGFLDVTTSNGDRYMIYYTPQSNGDTTNLYVPVVKNPDGTPGSPYPYEISGNNVDGWIISFLFEEGVPVPDTLPDPENADDNNGDDGNDAPDNDNQ